MRIRIMILFMAMFLLCGCSDAPAVHKYELPDGLSFAERQYKNGYKKYLKEHSDNREEDWQFYLKVRYYSPVLLTLICFICIEQKGGACESIMVGLVDDNRRRR